MKTTQKLLVFFSALFCLIIANKVSAEKNIPFSRQQVELSYAPLVKKSSPAVVNIFTRKIEVAGSNGKTIAEIHGTIHDIELSPNSTVEWFFYPMTKGKNLKLYCHKDNHEEMGMVGTINIVGSLSLYK